MTTNPADQTTYAARLRHDAEHAVPAATRAASAATLAALDIAGWTDAVADAVAAALDAADLALVAQESGIPAALDRPLWKVPAVACTMLEWHTNAAAYHDEAAEATDDHDARSANTRAAAAHRAAARAAQDFAE